MIEEMKSYISGEKELEKGKKPIKPQDLVRLYDTGRFLTLNTTLCQICILIVKKTQPKGSSKNYVDKILLFFTIYLTIVDIRRHFTYYLTFVHVDSH